MTSQGSVLPFVPETAVPVVKPVLSVLVEALGGALQARGLMIVPAVPSDRMVQTAALLSGMPEAMVRQVYSVMIATCCGEAAAPSGPVPTPAAPEPVCPAPSPSFAQPTAPATAPVTPVHGYDHAATPLLKDALSDAMSVFREARSMQSWQIVED